MPKIVISGATGQLARLITSEIAQSIPAADITLASRSPEKLADEAAAGMRVVKADYRDRASLDAAYQGCDTLMLISGLNLMKRIPEHRNAIEAAEAAGIKHIVYTSVSGVHPMNRTPSSGDHYATEQMLQKSNLGFTALRNQAYSEFASEMAMVPLMTGVWDHVGEGLFSPVSRGDIAACAAAILLDPDKHRNVSYEITGPELISFRELSQRFAAMYDRPIEFRPISPEEMWARFDEWGVPRVGDPEAPSPHCFGSNELVENYVAWAELYHAVLSHHVEFITGKKPRTLNEIMLEAKPMVFEQLQRMAAGERSV